MNTWFRNIKLHVKKKIYTSINDVYATYWYLNPILKCTNFYFSNIIYQIDLHVLSRLLNTYLKSNTPIFFSKAETKVLIQFLKKIIC